MRYNAASLMTWQHISEEDLERYHLGMVKHEVELAPLEEHLLACGPCFSEQGTFAGFTSLRRET